MIRYLAFAAALAIAAPVLAQPALNPTQTLDALVHQAVEREVSATVQLTALPGQVAQLRDQVAALTKERDELKAAAAQEKK